MAPSSSSHPGSGITGGLSNGRVRLKTIQSTWPYLTANSDFWSQVDPKTFARLLVAYLYCLFLGRCVPFILYFGFFLFRSGVDRGASRYEDEDSFGAYPRTSGKWVYPTQIWWRGKS